ncbi:Mlp family lipoprotein (plasmid) [Borrelia miyamotoi]|uniref:Mlp family lipoprotein n=1 Tax=Borrelia miyamotoi TaxID=47466 RepID=A0AAX3JNW6_9SPIR|nr:Mlp family lipoprotein [Borrelia miyamotoi]QFP42362.1 Mlp family lipoprotein [Borrelia miyamotoi]QFP48483.1 Mlp family lipoprotein [Borrelia miyamotoi]WAZ72384.1 Mlp family lipoprotein [Borrelia miyamotoi]
MVKFINYLMLCGALLFFYCSEPNVMVSDKNQSPNKSLNQSLSSQITSDDESEVIVGLTHDEAKKYRFLKNILLKIFSELEYHGYNFDVCSGEFRYDQKINKLEPDLEKRKQINKARADERRQKGCLSFLDWLVTKPDKQKRLVASFSFAYGLLNKIGEKHAVNRTSDQYIIDLLDVGYKNYWVKGCGDDSNTFTCPIFWFFREIIHPFNNLHYDNHEKMFGFFEKAFLPDSILKKQHYKILKELSEK